MKLRILIVIAILIVILTHCKKDEAIPGRFITIDENRKADVSLNLKKRIIFTDIVSPKIAISPENDKIFVYGQSTIKGKKSFIVKIYNNDLEYISQKLFYYGQGPGDVGATNIITPFKDKIYICENSNSRVSVYDSGFNYSISTKIPTLETAPFEMIKNGRFFIASVLEYKKNLRADSFRIGTFPSMESKEFFETAYINPYDEKRKFILDAMEFSYFYKDKYIFILLMNKYQILKFDLNGKKVDDLTVKSNLIKITKELETAFLADQGYKNKSYSHRVRLSKTVAPASWIVPLEKGFIVTRRKDYFTKCDGFAEGDYFTYQLNFVGKAKSPCFYNIFKITLGFLVISTKYDNNVLYLVNEVGEDLFLEKWEVKE